MKVCMMEFTSDKLLIYPAEVIILLTCKIFSMAFLQINCEQFSVSKCLAHDWNLTLIT